MLPPDVLQELMDDELRAVRKTFARERRLEETEVALNWRQQMRGLRFPPLTCAVCNTRTFCGPLCFDHMDEGRSMSRMWRDYVDPTRRSVMRIEAFLGAQRLREHPEDEWRVSAEARKLHESYLSQLEEARP